MVRFEGKCTKIKFSPGYDYHQSRKHAIVYKWIKGMEDLRLNNSLSFFFKKKIFLEGAVRIYRKQNFPPEAPIYIYKDLHIIIYEGLFLLK